MRACNQKRPGGIRSFPLLALTGALLYQLDPDSSAAASGGAVGAWRLARLLLLAPSG